MTAAKPPAFRLKGTSDRGFLPGFGGWTDAPLVQ